jgi:1,4-dihydroxy-2-naphthoate octaprenyltransferase
MNRNHLKISSEGSSALLYFSGFRYWTASLLPALVGTSLPFWLDPPAFSFRWFAAVEFLFATILFHTGFSFLHASFEGKLTTSWAKFCLQLYAGICIVFACLLGLHINTGLTLHNGVPKSIFVIYGLATLFVGVLYVVPPFNFYRRVGGEIVIAVGLGMIPVLGAYLVQVGDLTRTVYLASLPLVVTTGLWVWVDELATRAEDEKAGRRTMVIDFGTRFSGRYGTLALSILYFATLGAVVCSASTSPLTLTALLLMGVVRKIIITTWKGYSHPEWMVAIKRNAYLLHLFTCLIFAASSLVASSM